MKDTYACVNGVQGTAKIDHFSPRGRIRGDIYILAVNPARVRFDVVSPFGATLYTLTSDGERFQMLDVKEKQFLNGPATACNLARLTQVPIPGHALVSLAPRRGPRPRPHPTGRHDRVGRRGGFYRVQIASTREASQEIHLEVRPEDIDKPWSEQRVRVTDVRVSQRGVDLYHAELKNHEPVQHRRTPRGPGRDRSADPPHRRRLPRPRSRRLDPDARPEY